MNAGRYVGGRVHRREDPRLLTGRGEFVDDIVLPGMLHATFVRSPFARAAIRGIETSAALAAPGVHFVFTATDLNQDVKEQWHSSMGPSSPETPRPPLAEGEVRFVGDPIALVVADSAALAEDATELVDVDYEPLPAVVDYMTAGHADVLVHASHGSNVIGKVIGQPESALADVFAAAAHVVSETIYQQACAAAPIEGRGLIVNYSRATGDLTIHAATQAPHEVRLFCSRLLGIPEHRVRVVMRDTGGGFGQKVMVQRDEMCVMLAAPKVGAPLKWVEDRRENLLAAGKSRHEHGTATMAFDVDGSIQGAFLDFVSDCGAYPTPWPVMTAAAVGMLFPGPYRVPCAGFSTETIYTNTVGRAAYRGPWQFESLAREVLLDIAARRLGIDPVELRRRNLLHRDELPYRNPNGMTYDSISPLETLEQALAILDYDAFRAEQTVARKAGRYLGVGTASYVEPSTPGYGAYATEAATIRIEPSGMVNVLHRRWLDGQQPRDHRRAAHCGCAGHAHPGRSHHPGRHRLDRLRRGHRWQPQRVHDSGRDPRDGRDPARAHPRYRRPPARSCGRRCRARREPRARPRHTLDRHLGRGDRRTRLLRAARPAVGRSGRARGERSVHSNHGVDLGQRHARLHMRGRRRDRSA